jgi:hypothetical protein
LTAFPDVSTRTALRVLAAAPTLTAAAALSAEDLRALLREVRVALPAADSAGWLPSSPSSSCTNRRRWSRRWVSRCRPWCAP